MEEMQEVDEDVILAFESPICPVCKTVDESRPWRCKRCLFCWACDAPFELCDCELPLLWRIEMRLRDMRFQFKRWLKRLFR